ncbi:hypothetical protein [Ottowia sp.]|uniref:hypothetical protein n=1 Tax=Ottowia sp. TaxID=1898956 RepID=UPI003A8561A9
MRTGVGAVAAPAVVALVSGCVRLPAAELLAAQENRFADAYMQLLPVGPVMDAAAEQDSRWPLDKRSALVSTRQLNCVRSGLTSAQITPRQRQSALAYAKAHPDTLMGDLRVLESGAARLFGQSVMQGAGVGPEPVAATSQEKAAITALSTAPEFAPLRRFTGIDQLVDGAAQDAGQRGRQFGQRLLVPYLTDAFVRCHIPVKLLF